MIFDETCGSQMPRAEEPLGPIRRIIIVRALHLGDLLLAVPAWRALKEGFPGAEITLVGLPWARDFIERFRYVDRFLEFPGFPGMLELEVDLDKTRSFLLKVREEEYDLAIAMHGDGSASVPFVLNFGSRHSLGYYSGEAQSRQLSLGLPYVVEEPEILRHLRLIALLGVPLQGLDLECPIIEADRQEVARVLPQEGFDGARPVVAIHPGARPPSRRWPQERFARLAGRLVEQRNAQVILLGGPEEVDLVATIASQIGEGVVDLAGRLSVGGMAALLRMSDLFVGNDSGPAHLAEAVGTRSVTIFGSASRVRWAPLIQKRHRIVYAEVHCSPCPHWSCPTDHRCLDRVQVEVVFSAACSLLEKPIAT